VKKKKKNATPSKQFQNLIKGPKKFQIYKITCNKNNFQRLFGQE
jgi:hypothetical protein